MSKAEKEGKMQGWSVIQYHCLKNPKYISLSEPNYQPCLTSLEI